MAKLVLALIDLMSTLLDSGIEYLKGIGPLRGDMLRKELNIHNFRDLLEHFPFRYVDKTKLNKISDIRPDTESVQLITTLSNIHIKGEFRSQRLIATAQDETGSMELVWFQGATRLEKWLKEDTTYLIYGKPGFFNGKPQLSHPEVEIYEQDKVENKPFLEPIYPTTDKLKARGFSGKQFGKFTYALLSQVAAKDVPENIPHYILKELNLPDRFTAYCNIHFPPSWEAYRAALNRIKFEEFFIAQVKLAHTRSKRHTKSKGLLFKNVGDLFNDFFYHALPFELTNAQKRVMKDIRRDTASGHQMNRLLQGDVGSGKTIVALMAMLLAADNGYQSCMMAPTEILAQQHYNGLKHLLQDLPINVELISGGVKGYARKKILEKLKAGIVHIVVGTHAVIEDKVQFSNLGLAIVDEQHRFGVAQRAKLWAKSEVPPHVLVMTATPIPRTLAMTAYGDLDYSIMDELPPGRKPVLTTHRYETRREGVMSFIKEEVTKGRQAYIIYPLIEESETLSYENLMEGYENVKALFPEPQYLISMVHGKMQNDLKEINMRRFVEGQTQIMVSTTVIEVGVNVPNASVMVIESTEKFGLSQLHQLRGRVGRGSEQSYCILMTGMKLTSDARERIQVMCATNDGFKIAEKDLEIRGPGDIQGTQQSGMINFKLASIVSDRSWLELAKVQAEKILDKDQQLVLEEHKPLRDYLVAEKKGKSIWSKIA